MPSTANSSSYDLIIVGAGVSGLFAAWRLLESNPAMRILFIEKLGRTGGRLQTTTVEILGQDRKVYPVKDEEGGMRFNSQMPYINQLIGDLGLGKDAVPFVMSGIGNQQYYFRGTQFTSLCTPRIWSILFKLAPGESNQSAGDLLQTVLIAVLEENLQFQPTGTSPAFTGDAQGTKVKIPNGATEWQIFRNQCSYGGTIMNQWGFWALLRSVQLPGGVVGLTEECIDWLEHAIGFMGPTQALINAGESLQIIFDFPTQMEFQTLGAGFGSIPETLEAALRANPNVTFRLNEQVTKVVAANSGYSVFSQQLVGGSYGAAQVILAIPHEGIVSIMASSPVLQGNRSFGKAVDSVQDMLLAKIGLYFDQRWWHNAATNLTCGPSFTDLPLGSVYCFQQYPLDPKLDQDYNGPAALTIYTDYDRANFWMEMNNLGDPYVGPIGQPLNTEAPSTALVAEAMRQIGLLFDPPAGLTVPEPVLATFRVWGLGQFGFGYHQYKLRVNDVTDVDPHIWNPAPGVFVCNESWSPEQGWVEGALMATDNVLTQRQGFGLPPYYPPPAGPTP